MTPAGSDSPSGKSEWSSLPLFDSRKRDTRTGVSKLALAWVRLCYCHQTPSLSTREAGLYLVTDLQSQRMGKLVWSTWSRRGDTAHSRARGSQEAFLNAWRTFQAFQMASQ